MPRRSHPGSGSISALVDVNAYVRRVKGRAADVICT